MPKTLLVADDSVVIQKLVGLSFANEEVDLITTDNGDDAINLARERKPDLVLADVVMPGKSGYEVCQGIKQDPELGHIPVLLLTGTFEAFDETRSREVSADGHITKPFEAQVLVERVNELLSRQPANVSAPVPEPAPAAPNDDYDFFEEDRRDAAPENGSNAASVDPRESGGAAPPSPSFEQAGADFGRDDLRIGGIAGDGLRGGAEVPADLDLVAGPSDIAGGFAGDRTVAVMPQPREESMAAHPGDPLASTPDLPVSDEADPGLTVLADFDFSAADEAPDLTPPDETILANDFSFDATTRDDSNLGSPILGDDLFGDTQSPSGGTASSSFDFGTSEPPTPAPSANAEMGRAPSASAPELETAPISRQPVGFGAQPDREQAAAGSTAGLDPAEQTAPVTRGPFEAGPPLSTSLPAPAAPEPDDLLEIEPLRESPPELQVELEHTTPQPPPLPSTDSFPGTNPLPATDPLLSADPATPAPSASATAALGDSMPDLAPMIRERLHETLEKVAWEAFADISDTIVRQVIEKVESIAWEVIPQMTEMMIQEEIRRMKGDSE